MFSAIQGVELKALETHADNRGFFRELIRHTDRFFDSRFGQLSHSLVNAGVVKAWHGHTVQTQWNYVATGLIQVALYDARQDSPTFRATMEFLAGESYPAQVYSFPPGVLHGYRCVSGPMNIIYVTSGTYDIADEVRLGKDDIAFPKSWTDCRTNS